MNRNWSVSNISAGLPLILVADYLAQCTLSMHSFEIITAIFKLWILTHQHRWMDANPYIHTVSISENIV